ncbi:hypothetical protein ACA910_006043 [Epithemia clementina (nom. ined.)]
MSNAKPTNAATTETTTTTTPSRMPRITVRLKRIHAVAQWSWNANDDVCGICHAAFEGTAPGVRYPGEDSPVVWGKCGHAFHLQCVSRWLQQSTSKNLCPICRQEWEFGQNPIPNNNTAITANNNNAQSGGENNNDNSNMDNDSFQTDLSNAMSSA